MKTPTKQPDTDLAELHAKVVELAKVAQTKKEELRRKEAEKKTSAENAAKKAEEEKRLENLFTDGVNFAKWTREYCGADSYAIKFSDFSWKCCNTEEYIKFLETALADKTEGIRKSIENVQDRIDSIPGIRAPFHDDHTRRVIQNLENERKSLTMELLKVEAMNKRFRVEVHPHMEGFIETIFKSKPNADALLNAVKVAMIAGADIFREFDGRKRIIKRLRNTVVGEIEDKLSTDPNLDEREITRIERILDEVRKTVEQQVKE